MDVDARMLRLEDTLVRLGDAQARTEAALTRLTETQARTEAALARLTEAQARTEVQLVRQGTQLQTLMHWQRGETGRRDGERYERDVVRRAAVLFNGGSGGTPEQPEVQRRLARRLHTVLAAGILPSEADPFLADLLWWKGEQVAVVEVSLQIDGDEINRVIQRTNTLRRGASRPEPSSLVKTGQRSTRRSEPAPYKLTGKSAMICRQVFLPSVVWPWKRAQAQARFVDVRGARQSGHEAKTTPLPY
jgi:hypothetical protein